MKLSHLAALPIASVLSAPIKTTVEQNAEIAARSNLDTNVLGTIIAGEATGKRSDDVALSLIHI